MRCASRDALTPGLSVLRTKVFRSLIACKTFYHQTCAKTSPILLFGHAALPPRIPKQFLSLDHFVNTRIKRLMATLVASCSLLTQKNARLEERRSKRRKNLGGYGPVTHGITK